MRVEDLHHEELLELDPDGGLIRFAGRRALLLDAVAMGILRQYLVDNFGLTAARAVLTQFGFAHGWRMAEAMKTEFKWANDEEWRRAGPRIHALGGLFRVQPGSEDALSLSGATLLASYEAEQHLLHLGRADSPSRVVNQNEVWYLQSEGGGRCASKICITRSSWSWTRRAA